MATAVLQGKNVELYAFTAVVDWEFVFLLFSSHNGICIGFVSEVFAKVSKYYLGGIV